MSFLIYDTEQFMHDYFSAHCIGLQNKTVKLDTWIILSVPFGMTEIVLDQRRKRKIKFFWQFSVNIFFNFILNESQIT